MTATQSLHPLILLIAAFALVLAACGPTAQADPPAGPDVTSESDEPDATTEPPPSWSDAPAQHPDCYRGTPPAIC